MIITKRPQTKVGERTVGFIECLPDSYASGSNYPVIIALHGIGQAGSGSSADLDKLYQTGVLPVIAEGSFKNDCVVILPQYAGDWMGLYDFNALFDYILANYKVSPDKMALTGLSGGANSIIEILADDRNPKRISCFVMCDTVYAPNQQIADKIKASGVKSLWFQDVNDFTNGLKTIDFVRAWVSAIGANASLTTRSGSGHGFWNEVYKASFVPSVYDWMCSQVKPGASTQPAPTPTPTPSPTVQRKAIAILYDDGSRQDIK